MTGASVDFAQLERGAAAAEEIRAEVAALRDDVRKLTELVTSAKSDGEWKPLHEILDRTPGACRALLRTHSGLRALGVPLTSYTLKFKSGLKAGEEYTATKLAFRKQDVDVYFAALRAGGGR